MGNFTRDTFDKLKHYVGVRLQQGVPIVDADWNEQEDIHKFELQSFLKWFIGSGVPHGNNGFCIDPPSDGADNDFTIKGGTTDLPGRCLVEGWDVIIEYDIKYTGQILFTNPNNEADEWGVDPLQPLSPPLTGTRTNTVYLDVWEREVDSGEDNNLVHPAIGMETCVRIKREWVVRVAEGATQPPIPPIGHVFYPLAYLNRTAGKNAIEGDDIIDLRRKNLSLYHLKEDIESLAISVDTHNHSKLVGSGGIPDPALVVDNNGNVGIGSTVPQSKLHVNGGLKLDIGEGLEFFGEGDYFGQYKDARIIRMIDVNGTGGKVDGGIAIEGHTPGDGARKSIMAVKGNTGNVGIGTIEPKNKLDVEGGVAIGAGYSGTNTAPENGLLIEGKVGIGITNPVKALDVKENGSNYVIARLKREGVENLAAGLELVNSNGESWNVQSKGDNNFVITETDVAERFVIEKDTGNVGVGTNSPSGILHIETRGYMTPKTLFVVKNSGEIGIGTNNPGGILNIKYEETGGPEGYISKDYFFIANGTGNVGIGTPEPKNKLDVKGGAVIGSDYGGNDDAQAPSNGLLIQGNVGIGAIAPLTKLHVHGSSTFGDTFTPDSNCTRNIVNLIVGKNVDGASNGIAFVETTTSGGYGMKLGYDGMLTGIRNALRFYNSDDEPIVTIQNGGNVGIGTNNPTYKLQVEGNLHVRNWATVGSDYAEYFESQNKKAIPPGTAVVLENGKVRRANKNDTPIGIISTNPGMVSGVHVEWPQKYLRDELGNIIMEKYKEEIMVPKKEKVKKERQKVKKKKVKEEMVRTEVVKVKGKYCQKEISESVEKEVEEPVFKEVNLYDASGKNKIGKHQVPVMETHEEEINVLDEKGQPVMIGSGKFETKTRPKINPEYDETKDYIPREKRPEWNCVGLLGQLPLRKGQPTAPTWVKIKNISKDVELWLVK